MKHLESEIKGNNFYTAFTDFADRIWSVRVIVVFHFAEMA